MQNIKIQVLGSGCPTCKNVFKMVSQIAQEIDKELKVEYITDVSKIIEMGIMTSPVLIIGKSTRAGKDIPNTETIKQKIKEELNKKI